VARGAAHGLSRPQQPAVCKAGAKKARAREAPDCLKFRLPSGDPLVGGGCDLPIRLLKKRMISRNEAVASLFAGTPASLFSFFFNICLLSTHSLRGPSCCHSCPCTRRGISFLYCTPLQPFSQKSHTPTVPNEFQIGLHDPAEADWEHFGTVVVRDFWDKGSTVCRLFVSSFEPEWPFFCLPQIFSRSLALQMLKLSVTLDCLVGLLHELRVLPPHKLSCGVLLARQLHFACMHAYACQSMSARHSNHVCLKLWRMTIESQSSGTLEPDFGTRLKTPD